MSLNMQLSAKGTPTYSRITYLSQGWGRERSKIVTLLVTAAK